MILPAAFALGVASAVTYGVAAAVQHDAVQQARGAGLRQLIRDRRWLASIGGDTGGLVLQLGALTLGPVVLVQPLFVLCLPVALPLRARYGGPKPTGRDYLDCVLLVVGLVGFFAAVGRPPAPHGLSTATAAGLAAVSLAVGIATAVLVRPFGSAVRAVTLSSVTGLWFGVEAVLINAVSAAWSHHGGVDSLAHASGLVPLVAAVTVSLSGFAMSQLAFRAGHLGASFPAMLVVDPVVAVVLGAVLLDERVRSGAWSYTGYVVCTALIVVSTFRLAREQDAHPAGLEPARHGDNEVSDPVT